MVTGLPSPSKAADVVAFASDGKPTVTQLPNMPYVSASYIHVLPPFTCRPQTTLDPLADCHDDYVVVGVPSGFAHAD
eukprot:COSAG02_NODE_47010_length_344_cov_0.840816_1_plen_76_part_01